MGTRNLTVVILNKQVKVAQYGQWDGYLDGQGKTIFKFIEQMNTRKFKKALKECRFMTDKEVKQTWTNCGAEPNSDTVSFDIADKHTEKYPGLSRDTGAKVLQLIQNGTVKELKNEYEFAADSLFCEFAYVLDMDNKTLEIYKGFNKTKPKGRFAKMKSTDKDYNPVTLYKRLKFHECTDKMLKALIKKENEEQE
jgi:hypothetical protein